MKLILDHGIDHAVAAKRGDLLHPDSKAIDLGQLAYASAWRRGSIRHQRLLIFGVKALERI